MPKRSIKRNPDNGEGARGVVGAATQDLELTIEQAGAAARKATHAAAVAMRLADNDKKAIAQSSKKQPAMSKEPASPRASRSKPKS
jgi:hypothetical protein